MPGAGLDERFMRAALAQARLGLQTGEVPIGAVVVLDGQVRGEGFNQPIASHDPTAHAEVVAIRAAARDVENYRLTGATLYVTVEPCLMCVGAAVHARLARVVYGVAEPKAGAVHSTLEGFEHPALNHRIEATGGALESECRELLQGFFTARRAERAASPRVGAHGP